MTVDTQMQRLTAWTDDGSAQHSTRARALLIDLDGVIRRWDRPPGEPLEAAFGLAPGAVAAAAFSEELLADAILGRVPDAVWRQRTAERLALEHGVEPAAAEGAVAAWSAPIGRIDETVLALVRAVRERAPVVLVTNATTRLESDLDRLGLGAAFDAVVSSARVGARKPEAQIFRAALARAGTPASRNLLVDDTPGYVAAARALGLCGHLFVDAAGLEAALLETGLLGAD
jgi:putative hydrolase of the HAD superfamily